MPNVTSFAKPSKVSNFVQSIPEPTAVEHPAPEVTVTPVPQITVHIGAFRWAQGDPGWCFTAPSQEMHEVRTVLKQGQPIKDFTVITFQLPL